MDAIFADPIVLDRVTGLTVKRVEFTPGAPSAIIDLTYHHESGKDEDQPSIVIDNAEAYQDLLTDTALPSAIGKLLGHLVKIGRVPPLADSTAVQP